MKQQRNALLVADPDPFRREAVARAFRRDCRVLEAESGREALFLLRSQPEHIAALILHLPEQEGAKLLSQIRAEPASKRVPTIAIVEGDADSQRRALQNGARDVIAEPYAAEVLHRRVHNVVLHTRAEQYRARVRVLEEQLRRAETDSTTGLCTETTFLRRVEEELREHPRKRYVLCRWDIDRFRVYNELYGRPEGDRLLREIGAAYRGAGGARALVSGHLGADQFATLCEARAFDEKAAAEALRRALRRMNPEFDFLPRLGLFLISDRSLDVPEMCQRAGLAQQALKGQRNELITWFEEGQRRVLLRDHELLADKEDALATGQFTVYLQPQLHSATGALIGAEALVRWIHPCRGMLLPHDFVPLFERNGFIWKLDQTVVEQVCALQRRWLDAGLSPVPISVNLSRLDVYNKHLCRDLRLLLKRYGLGRELLRLELPEVAYFENPQLMAQAVRELREAGFSVQLDHFTAASLQMLRDVPFDLLKLDGSFLRDNEPERNGAILSSLACMARSLRLPILAEGVESSRQETDLRDVGFPFVQGFALYRPLPPNEFECLLRGLHRLPTDSAASSGYAPDIPEQAASLSS